MRSRACRTTEHALDEATVKPHPRQHAGGPAGHPHIRPITSTEALHELCERLGKADFVAVDTEFIRESTYWPILCLVQLAGPNEAALVDPLAPGINLAPLLALMNVAPVLKVLVDRVLRLRGDVLAFASAPAAQGGAGAVLVLLDTR